MHPRRFGSASVVLWLSRYSRASYTASLSHGPSAEVEHPWADPWAASQGRYVYTAHEGRLHHLTSPYSTRRYNPQDGPITVTPYVTYGRYTSGRPHHVRRVQEVGNVAAVGARLLSAAFRVDPPDVRQGRLQPGGVVGRLARCRHAIVVGHHMMSSRRSRLARPRPRSRGFIGASSGRQRCPAICLSLHAPGLR